MTLDPWWLAGGVPPSACVAAYQPIGADSLQASYVNLANPGTYNCYVPAFQSPVAPKFDTAGWYFNPDDTYTALAASIPLPYDQTWTMICRLSDHVQIVTYPCVMGKGTYPGPYVYFQVKNNDNQSLFRSGDTSGQLFLNKTWSSGVFCIAGRSVYVNGNLEGTIPSSTTTGNTGDCWFGSPGTSYSNKARVKIQAAAIYNTTLSQAEVNAITHAMTALTEASLPLHHMPSAGMRRWAKLYSPQGGTAFIPAWARNSNRIITPGIQLP